jgi:hypothetical protein
MGFTIINNKKVDENRIVWKFETLDREFTSSADKFKRNVAFWQTKFNIGMDVKVEILNGVEHLYAHLEEEKTIVDVEYTDITDIPTDATTDLSETLKSRLEENEYAIANDPAIESRVDEPTKQSDLFEDAESDVHTPKRKSRKKTS